MENLGFVEKHVVEKLDRREIMTETITMMIPTTAKTIATMKPVENVSFWVSCKTIVVFGRVVMSVFFKLLHPHIASPFLMRPI